MESLTTTSTSSNTSIDSVIDADTAADTAAVAAAEGGGVVAEIQDLTAAASMTTSSNQQRQQKEPPATNAFLQMLKGLIQSTTLGLWFYKGFHDCLHFRRSDRLQDRPIDFVGYVQFAAVKVLLEVCGAAGAVWGSSEVYRLRTVHNTNSFWRPVCWMVAIIFAIRFGWHSKHFLEQEKLEYPPIKRHHRRLHKMSFVQIFSTKFVLEVLGAAGAIWGFFEAATIRTPHNKEQFHLIAGTVGGLFLFRYISVILDFCLCFASSPALSGERVSAVARWAEMCIAKMVLEVFGSGGAVWGFSDIFGLRTPYTLGVWRPMAIAMSALFFLRWIWQMCGFYKQEQELLLLKPSPTMETEVTSNDEEPQMHDVELEMSDLQFHEEDNKD